MRTEINSEAFANFTAIMGRINANNGQRQFYDLYPDNDEPQEGGTTIHARHKYAKHLEFFEAGAD